MGVADREVNLKKEKEACSSKQREEEKVYEEAARARSEPEALDSRYPLDHSEGGNSEDCGSWEEVVESGEGGATRFDSDQGDGDATIFDSDEVLFFWDESEDENSQEFELSDSGEGYSQEQKAASSQSFTRRPNGIASMSMALPPRGRQQLVLPSCGLQQLLSSTPSLPTFCPRTSTSVSMERFTSPRVVCRSGSLQSALAVAVSNGRLDSERREIRLGLPSKGRMADGALDLLKGCQLSVKQLNPRQYVTEIPQLSNLQVWLQRPKDIVRALLSGHLDIGIVGLDTVSEYGQGNKDLIIVHEALGFGDCHLSLAIPNYGIFEKIKSVKELSQMPQWTEEKPLRVATGFIYLGPKFMKENGLKHVRFLTGEGALEAFPAMGTADVILDLVSSGKTLRENNLKEIEGGKVLESQAVLVASRKSLVQREGVHDTTREILERLEAHLKAVDQLMVTANMRGSSAEEVAKLVLGQPSLSGLHGPTISQAFCIRDGEVVADCYAIAICVPKKALDSSVRQLRAIGGSEVLAYPLTYILDEGSPRWQQLLSELGL